MDRIWEAEFESHTIRVINRNSLLPPFTGEVLEVDGQVVDEIRGDILRLFSTLTCKMVLGGVERKIEARLAVRSGSLRMGCQIFVDGSQVGGDSAIRYPDPEKIDGYLQRGFLGYFLKIGLPKYGFLFAVFLMLFRYRTDPLPELVFKFMLSAIFFGLVMSWMWWRGMKSRERHMQNIVSPGGAR